MYRSICQQRLGFALTILSAVLPYLLAAPNDVTKPDVPFTKVYPSENVPGIRAGKFNDVEFDIEVEVNEGSGPPIGRDLWGLWKVSCWTSTSADGEGKRIDFTEQVLTVNQSTLNLVRPNFVGRFRWISDIKYALDASDATCSEIRYICVELARGDNPELQDPQLQFTVEGVTSEYDLSPAPENLRGCRRTSCKDLPPCIYERRAFKHGNSFTLNPCTVCTCNNTINVCNIQMCQTITCSDGQEPVKVDGECCETCSDASTVVDGLTSVDYPEGCMHQGNHVAFGDALVVDDCTTCHCQANHILRCEISSCPIVILCRDPIKLAGECCQVCPYYTPVFAVTPSNLKTVTEGQVNNIVFDIKAGINAEGNAVVGRDLWNVNVWASADPNGTGDRIGYTKQVLSEEQAAAPMVKTWTGGAIEFSLSSIEYVLNATDVTCLAMKYLCVKFEKGQNPQLEKPRLPFTVEGVTSADDRSKRPQNLIGCKTFSACNGTNGTITHVTDDELERSISDPALESSCIYNGVLLLNGQTITVHECTKCFCEADFNMRCEVRSCPTLFCHDPVNLEGECCDVCPYYVPVWKVKTSNISTITAGKVNDLNFNLTVEINNAGGLAIGRGLWNVSSWTSTSADGGGQRIGFMEQVLTDDQSAENSVRSDNYNADYSFKILDIEFSLDASDARCSEMNYFCVEFARGDNPELHDPRIPFTVEGVTSQDDVSPAPENLRSCSRVQSCEETNNLRCEDVECLPALCHNAINLEGECCLSCPYYTPVYKVVPLNLGTITEGQVNNIVFNMSVGINVAGTAIVGRGLWNVNVWASADPNGDGDKIGYRKQVLTEKKASVPTRKKNRKDLSLSNIKYVLDATNVTCSAMKYLCVEFGRGDNPRLEEPRLPFTVEGVMSFGDRSLASENLIGCKTFSACNGSSSTITYATDDGSMASSIIFSSLEQLLPCSYKGTIINGGQWLTVDECIVCTCDNSTVVCNIQGCPIISCSDGQEPVTVDGECCESCPGDASTVDEIISKDDLDGCNDRGDHVAFGDSVVVDECTTCLCQADRILTCEIRSCPSIFCDEPIKFKGECCGLCPYYIPVWQVQPSNPPAITAGKVNDVMFNLTVGLNGASGAAIGRGLWKVSSWTSCSADGGGTRIGFKKQVLTEHQAATNTTRPNFFGGYPFQINDIKYTLDASDATCSEMKYLCVELTRGDNPKLHDPRLQFTVQGVTNMNDLSPVPTNLRGCTRIPSCEDTCAIRNTISFSVAKKSSQIAETETVTISWDHVFNIAGGALNPETGIFNCSVAGSYSFTFFIAKSPNAPPQIVKLIKNDEFMVAGLDQSSTNSAESTSNAVILDLCVNDLVWLELYRGGEIFGSPERFSTFSGFLI